MQQSSPATTATLPLELPAAQLSTPRFDLIYALLSIWFVGGLMVDTWAHSYDLLNAQETFFTPWHGLFYTGYLAIAVLLIASIWRRRAQVTWRDVSAWRDAIPRGYELSLLGVAMFVIGGGLDPFWHLIAGREVGLDTLMSPTHIFFAVAMVLIISGPIRSAWHREDSAAPSFRAAQSFRAILPVLISVFLVQWMFTFQTLYSHPIQVFPSLSQYGGTALLLFGEMVGTSGFPIHTAIFVGLVLILLRRWRLPPGSFTFLIGAHYLMLAPQNMLYPMILPLIGVMILAGAAIDLLYAWLRPSHAERRRLYLFAFLMPVILYSAYFAVLLVLDTTTWSAHLVAGNIAVTGLTGLSLAALVSTIAAPAPLTETDTFTNQ